MEILIFSWRGPKHPNAGGAETSTHEHAKGWVAAGYGVTLFTSSFPGAKKEEVIDGVKIIRKGWQVFGVQIRAIEWYLFGNHPYFDLVIDQFHGIPFFTPIFVKVKKMAFIHEVTKEVWKLNHLPQPFNLIPAIFGPILEPLFFKLYKNIPFMTVSASTKKELEELGIKNFNINVINNGITVPSNINAKKEKVPTLIYLGVLSKDKGIETAIKVFSILNKKRNLQYWIVGEVSPVYFTKLEKQTNNLGISGKVKFFGYVSEEEKFRLLKKAQILVNPSIREGWGLVVIEAAAVGIPTVAFNVAGLKDSIKDDKTGLLAKEYSAEALSDSILRLIDNKRLYLRLSKNASNWSKNFSWEKASGESLQLLMSIVNLSNS